MAPITGPDRFGPARTAGPNEMSDVERLLAYEEIRQLAARYALAVDRRDVDALVGLFVADVRMPGGQAGREALRRAFERHLRADRVSILLVGGHVINLLDRDHAAGTVYATAEFGAAGRWIRQAIAYEDDYERRDGGWYFARRAHLLFYGCAPGYLPLDQPPANWPASPVGRGSIPAAWATWRRYWDDQVHQSAHPAGNSGEK
jgi:SnoaL-like protein